MFYKKILEINVQKYAWNKFYTYNNYIKLHFYPILSLLFIFIDKKKYL